MSNLKPDNNENLNNAHGCHGKKKQLLLPWQPNSFISHRIFIIYYLLWTGCTVNDACLYLFNRHLYKTYKQIIVCSVMFMVSMETKTLTYCVWFYLRLFRRILWLDNFLSWHATIPIRSLWCIYNPYKINIFVPTISVYIRPTSLK